MKKTSVKKTVATTKKAVTKKVAVKAMVKKAPAKVEKSVAKAVLLKPTQCYTRAEVASFLGLHKNTICPSKTGMKVVKGKVTGSAVIAYLESGKCRKAKVGRKYASGSVQVVR